MLQIHKQRPTEDYDAADFRATELETASPRVAIEAALGIVRRQITTIAFVTILTLALGFLYLFVTPPVFMARATMLIDREKVQVSQQQQFFPDLPIDAAAIDSEIEILKSDEVARAVIKKLHLIDGPEFGQPTGLARFMGFAVWLLVPSQSDSGTDSETDALQGAVSAFQSRLDAQRMGGSFMIAVTYKSHDAKRAAEIANATVDTYINYQIQAKFDAMHRANVWLQDRVRELADESAAADRALADFKAQHNMASTATGKSISEQQLTDLNARLLDAKAQAATAQAKLDRIDGIISKGGEIDDAAIRAAVSDSLTNPVIIQLRTKYLELVNREIDWSARFGPNHLAVVNLRTQIHEVRNSIFDELKQIAETYKSDLAIAKQRQVAAEKALADSVSQSSQDNLVQSTLADLESAAKSRHALYDDLEQRYTQSLPSGAFAVSNARLITPASPPGGKSSPKPLLILALAAFGGLAMGGGLGMFREMLDRVFRTSEQIERSLQTTCIALVPAVKDGLAVTPSDRPDQALSLVPSKPRTIVRLSNIIWTVTDSPFSRFTEAIRSLKLAVDLGRLDRSQNLIGFTSAIPNEGKTTIAASLAQLAAQAGARVILVDADFRNPSLSRTLTPNANCGILEVIAGKKTLEDVVWHDPLTNMAFLPAFVPFRLAHSSEILSSDRAELLFAGLRNTYDYVIVDLPPLAPVIDVRATKRLIDTYVLVVEWGRTKIPLVERALSEAPGVYENLLGVLLNKADIDVVRRYDGHLGDYYKNDHFARYGYLD